MKNTICFLITALLFVIVAPAAQAMHLLVSYKAKSGDSLITVRGSGIISKYELNGNTLRVISNYSTSSSNPEKMVVCEIRLDYYHRSLLEILLPKIEAYSSSNGHTLTCTQESPLEIDPAAVALHANLSTLTVSPDPDHGKVLLNYISYVSTSPDSNTTITLALDPLP